VGSVKGMSNNEFLATVIGDIRPAAGVRETLTCLVMSDEEED